MSMKKHNHVNVKKRSAAEEKNQNINEIKQKSDENSQ